MKKFYYLSEYNGLGNNEYFYVSTDNITFRASYIGQTPLGYLKDYPGMQPLTFSAMLNLTMDNCRIEDIREALLSFL